MSIIRAAAVIAAVIACMSVGIFLRAALSEPHATEPARNQPAASSVGCAEASRTCPQPARKSARGGL